MKKLLIRLVKLDLFAMMHESVIELFFPMLFFLFPLLFKNSSSSFIKIVLLFIPIVSLGIMLKGFTFSFFINYVKTMDLLLIYFSIKYLVINSLTLIVTTLVFSCYSNIQIEYTIFSIFVVSVFTLSSYFLLFFYFLSTSEPEFISGTILFVLGNITFYVTYYFFSKISYWAIAFIVFMLVLYFKTIVPLFKAIMLKRFEIIMEKIL